MKKALSSNSQGALEGVGELGVERLKAVASGVQRVSGGRSEGNFFPQSATAR
jgi:hypothetical protein